MNIATIVVTTPRPEGTLKRTLNSLHDAGFSDVEVHNDDPSSGHFSAYYTAIEDVVNKYVNADAYLVVEDDVVFCKNTREYLCKTLWPTDEVERIGFCSLYLPGGFSPPKRGWSETTQYRKSICCTQAWLYPPASARFLLEKMAPLRHDHPVGGDHVISQFLQKHDFTIWHHLPSLAQHSAPIGNSTVGNQNMTRNRKANSFPGEDCDASELSFTSELP
jgi:GR25 family glycosyltransferase involved in LPS biosynthesis